MNTVSCRLILVALCLGSFGGVTGFSAEPGWQQTHDQLVARLRAPAKMETMFGPAYEPLYHAALGWYENWGGRNSDPVDGWMVSPETYASELADALEHGRNFFAEYPGALLPLSFQAALPGGKTVNANYWLSIPEGFGASGRKFPLVISLPGSGWLAHKISFVRKGKTDARVFEVTPVNEKGPWQLDFLNAYLDELLRILPVDPDHVYVQGHSLGAMATWEWAMRNPERFAAISPRSGTGEPYRATRIKNIPAWVIHGERDDVVLSGFSDQMVTALQSCGGSVKYSVLKGVEHNMPSDLDEGMVKDWYLQQTRRVQPAAPDPRDALGISVAGFSDWQIVSLPQGPFWRSSDFEFSEKGQSDPSIRAVEKVLFDRAHAMGELVDEPVRQRITVSMRSMSLWLACPKTLRPLPRDNPSTVTVEPRKAVRFYFLGGSEQALAHVREMTPLIRAASHVVSDIVWITPLSKWWDSASGVGECSIELQ